MLFLVNKFRVGDVLYGIKILLLLPHDSVGSACKMKALSPFAKGDLAYQCFISS